MEMNMFATSQNPEGLSPHSTLHAVKLSEKSVLRTQKKKALRTSAPFTSYVFPASGKKTATPSDIQKQQNATMRPSQRIQQKSGTLKKHARHSHTTAKTQKQTRTNKPKQKHETSVILISTKREHNHQHTTHRYTLSINVDTIVTVETLAQRENTAPPTEKQDTQ